jgi:uncharacterized membrane protein
MISPILPSCLLLSTLPPWLSWDPLSPYFTAAILLAVGVSVAIQKAPPRATVLGKVILCGPVFIAMPMAVFGTEHFLDATSVGRIMSTWIPAHTFWVIVVGACLVLGGLSIVLQEYAWLSAGLFGIMLLWFEMLMHIPRVVAAPHNRLAWAIALRDLAFSCGALSFAPMRAGDRQTTKGRWIIPVSRRLIAIVLLVWAVEYFLHPELLPGVPLRQLTPSFVPGLVVWGYLTSVIYAVCGICLLINKGAHLAATSVGLFVLFSTVVFCLPIMFQHGSEIGSGLNVLVDTLLLSGAMLCLVGNRCSQTPTSVSTIAQGRGLTEPEN